MKILLDAMGGDNAPEATIKGAVNAINEIKAEVILIGKQEIIEAKVKEIIAELGATSMKEMGLVMKTAKEKIGATADGKAINETAKKILG